LSELQNRSGDIPEQPVLAEVIAREIGRVTIAEALELTATISTPPKEKAALTRVEKKPRKRPASLRAVH